MRHARGKAKAMKTAIAYYSQHHGNTKMMLDAFRCLGWDAFGPFKPVGGIAKGHPDEADIAAAVRFYQELGD